MNSRRNGLRKQITETKDRSLELRREEGKGNHMRGVEMGETKGHALGRENCTGSSFIRQGCQTHFHRGPHQPLSCLQKAECNFRTV